VTYKLYSDANTFHAEYPATASIVHIMADRGIRGRARRTAYVGNTKQYRVDGSGFEFEVRTVYPLNHPLNV